MGINIKVYYMFDSANKIIGIVETFIDITERKNNERQGAILKSVLDNIEL